MKKALSILLLLLSVTAILTSCNRRKREIARLVKNWQHKEILFPDNLEAKIFGRDTVCPELFKKKYKILNYIDTTGCTACQTKFYEWQLRKREADSLRLDAAFLFIATVEFYEELETLQQINKCKIPIFYDREGKLMQLNRLPIERGFHTFLLDSANRVVLIGNPATNEKLWKLYLKRMGVHGASL